MLEQDENINHKIEESKRVTFKIWAILLVSFSTIFIVFFLNYANFQNLSNSLDNLSQPNNKLNLINEIFQDIAEADNQIQSYILTNDSSSWNDFNKSVQEALENINSLTYLIGNDSIQKKRIDSLKTLFNDKRASLEDYLQIKRQQQSRLFSNEILSQIADQLNDTAFIERELMRSDIITGTPVKNDTLPNLSFPDNYKGLGGFVRKVYNTKNDQELEYTYDVLIDTSIIRDYFPDTTLLAVKGILNRVMDAEANFRDDLKKTELAFLKNDEIFLENIKSIINLIKQQEESTTDLSKLQAKSDAETSNFTILITGIVGLLLSGALAFFILLDFNKSSQLRRQLIQQKEKAEKLAKIKEQFLANMSHEIRTPLHNVIGFSSLLNYTSLDEKQKSYLDAISKSNLYLKDLLDSILDNSKIESGKIELVNKPFNFNQLLEELRNVFSYSVLEKDIDFACNFPDELDQYYIIGDHLRLKQVLNNLLHNAVKFTNQGYIKLKVSTVFLTDRCKLSIIVSDSGMGISDENINKIFNLFEQENSSIHQNFGGTGLGLSIAKGFVEMMGGTITVESEEGKGTDFYIHLSFPYIKAPTKEIELNSSEKKYFQSVSILLIEDNEWNALLFKELIDDKVNSLHIFNNGQEAIDWLTQENNSTDIIFTDINMPVMDGYEFLNFAKKINIQVPIVAITAHKTKSDLTKLKTEGFDQVCSKPFQLIDIDNILNLYFNSDPEKYNPAMPKNSNGTNNQKLNNNFGFDFSTINDFAVNDELVFLNLLEELINNNEKQLAKLKLAIQSNDYEQIVFCCHQMKTTYDNLSLVNISEDLETIELMNKLGNAQKVVSKAQEILPHLMAILDQLKMFKRQYRTS
ncbi:ATP-binding protein [Peijinzhouia sedimentorum]